MNGEGSIPPPQSPKPDVMTPEMQAVADALRPILMDVFKDFAAAITRNVPAQVSESVSARLKQEFAPMVAKILEQAQGGGASPDFWMTPVRVVAVAKFDPFLEDPKSEKHAEIDTTPAQLLQNLHDAVMRLHTYNVAIDAEFDEEDADDEEDEEEEESTRKPRTRR